MKKMMTNKMIPLLLVMILMSSYATGFAEGTETKETNPEVITEEQDLGIIDDELMEFLAGYIKRNYYQEVSDEKLQEAVYKGIFETLDPHSKYFTKKEYNEFMIDTGGSFGGIGIYIQEKDGLVEVISPIEGTPGERADLKPRDLIVEIDGVDVLSITFEKALDMMRGDAGSEVLIGIRRGNSTEIMQHKIIREIIKVNPVKYEIKDGNVGYLRITQFNQQTAEKVKEALDFFVAKGIDDLIIDVRGNPGGYLDQVITVADYFVPKDLAIIHEQYNSEKTTTLAVREPYKFDISVLIDSGSASASEILAGAIKDHNLGKLVGTKSFGKGTVQTTRQLNTGAGLKLTIAEYLTAGDIHINGVGIKPDLVVEGLTEASMALYNNFVPMIESKVSKYGTRGLDVYGMQQRLQFLGYDLEVDGIFGPITKKNILLFQKSFGLDTTGVLDQGTETKLEEAVDMMLKGEIDPQLEAAMDILR